MNPSLNDLMESSFRIMQGVRSALPRRDQLQQELLDADQAQERGYYLPDEEERLRKVYQDYLSCRSVLWQMVHDLKPHLTSKDLKIFAMAFCSASMLMRSSDFLIEIARSRPVVLAKLDEAEPRFQLPRKTLTKIFRKLNSPRARWQYRQARRFYEIHRTQIHEDLDKEGYREIIPWLKEVGPQFDNRKRTLVRAILEYRFHSFGRRTNSAYVKVMFHLFRLSGSAIAELKQPFVKPSGQGKRVTSEVVRKIESQLQAGDILITRHDDALSNLFLPGFWPHAALYLGALEIRNQLKIPPKGDNRHTILEAKKDGVKLRTISECLTVDSFVILRPRVSEEELRQALTNALSHEGKNYDFVFDFRKAERLACTEVIYRAFHGVGPWQLELIKQSGRLALPAEALVSQALDRELVDVVLIYGVSGNQIKTGQEARACLLDSLNH